MKSSISALSEFLEGTCRSIQCIVKQVFAVLGGQVITLRIPIISRRGGLLFSTPKPA